MSMPRWYVDPALALLLLLLGVQFAVVITHSRRPPIADEIYYLGKARHIAEHHRFPPADPHALAVEKGRAWGNSDWRPQGYPLLLAIIGTGAFGDEAGVLRERAAAAQFGAVAAALIALYLRTRDALQPRARYVAAIFFGASPWVFDSVNDFGPDPFTVGIAGASALLLAEYAGSSRHRPLLLAAGSAVMSLSLLLRPEMIVMPPIVVGAAMLLRRCRPSAVTLAAALLPFVVVLALQAGYRTWFTGRVGIYGGHHIYNRGITDWINTWFGSEKEGDDFAFLTSDAKPATVPERAFDSDEERRLVTERARAIVARGVYSADDDAFFERLARERVRKHQLQTALLRGWHALHLWLNVDTNIPLLESLVPVPRAIRRPLLGGLVVLRVTALALAAFAFWRSAARWQAHAMNRFDPLVHLSFAYAVSRSLLMGVVLNWKQHRYVDSAWPLVLACAALALVEIPRLRTEAA